MVSHAKAGPSAVITTVANQAAYGSCGAGPKPPKNVAKKDAKPENIPGMKEKIEMRAVYIRQVFSAKMMTICTRVNAPGRA